MKKELEDILEEYAVETPDGNDRQVLKKWMAEYPDYAEELMDFAAMRAVARNLPEPEIHEDELSRLQEAGLERLHRFLDGQEKRTPVLTSLTGLAKKHGLDKQSFAKAAGMSVSLIMYMEKRRFQAASVPRKVLKRVARIVKITEKAVEEYLRGPRTAENLSYKAADRPKKVKQKDFEEAVKEDQTLTDEQKQELLETEPGE